MKLVSTNPARGYEVVGSVDVSTDEEIRSKVSLANKAELAWKELGMIHAPVATHLSLAHEEKTADKIAMVQNGLKQEVEKVVRMIAAGEMRALGAGGKDESALAIADPRAAIERYYAAALVEFNARADKVRDAAKSIAETVDKQFDAMAWGYVPEQTEFFSRLAVMLRTERGSVWFDMRLEHERVVCDNRAGYEALTRLSEPDAAREWIASGANIIVCEALQGVDPHNQLQHVATMHFKRLLSKEGQ